MALCIPIHLRQRTSRVYQDLRLLFRVLTSFVPPVHNQGVSLAPLQGLALWIIFLPTTGSFFVLSLTDLSSMFSRLAPCGGRFPSLLHISSSFPVTAGFSSQLLLLRVQSNCDRAFFCIPPLLCCLYLRPLDITHQLPCVIIHTLCKDCVEYPYNLTGHCHH